MDGVLIVTCGGEAPQGEEYCMRISVFDRVLLALFMLIIIAVLALVVLVCWQVIPDTV